jgi:NADPH-dependent 2,4-dienoyl-CoA reductase/sulfur reductase-like enzyme
MNPVVVVGTGIAGVRAAEALRAHKYAGEILLVSSETPCYRPAVSKEALNEVSLEGFKLPMKRNTDEFTWLLGQSVQASNLDAQAVQIIDEAGNASTLNFEGLIIASGLRSRHLEVPGPLHGRFSLRTLHDAYLLEPHLTPGARVVIIGSGFIGCEVAAIATKRGCAVTVISPERVPLSSALGDEVGQRIAAKHRSQGVEFLTEMSVRSFGGEQSATSIHLSGSREIFADVIVEAVGSVANTEWLQGNSLDLSNGVLTDQFLQPVGTAAPIRVCGDIARHPNALYGPTVRRIEHWTTAGDLGTHAGRSLARQLTNTGERETPFAAVPAFWSDQYDLQIQSFGIPSIGTEVSIVEADNDGSFIAEYSDSSGLVGVVGINRTSEVARYRKLLSTRA